MSTPQHLWLSGANGFIGSALLPLLQDDPGIGSITCWVRPSSLFSPSRGSKPVHIIRAIPDDAEHLARSLKGIDTVIHLASPTGSGHPAHVWDRDIRQLTARLTVAARDAGVRHFILVSSIAAGYEKTLRYPYALAKRAAEQEARDHHGHMGLSILRPSPVFGAGSPVFAGFARMASLPRPVLFGPGQLPCAPVARQDLCHTLLALCHGDPLGHEPLVVEGPEAVSLNDLSRRIRLGMGLTDRPPFHFPLPLIVGGLWLWESLHLPFPFTLGQLATFRNPSVGTGIRPAIVPETRTGLNTMIQESLTHPPAEPFDETDRECERYSRYLTGLPATPPIRSAYRQALARMPQPGEMDRKILALAVRSPRWTARMDAYTKFLAPTAIFRYRLSYLLAILETHPPHCRFLDGSDGHGLIRFGLGVIREGLGIAGGLFISLLRLGLKTAAGCHKGDAHV